MESANARVSKRTLDDLQWSRVKERALAHCQNELGERALASDRFLTNAAAVAAELRLVSELRRVVDTDGAPPLGGVRDVEGLLVRAEKEGVLDGDELVAIADTLRAGELSRAFLSRHDDYAAGVLAIADRMPDVSYVAERLYGTFEPDGRVRDDASPRLAELRAQVAGLHGRIRQQIDEHLRDHEMQDWLQDTYYTLREDRYVLPVKSQHRAAVPGIVHGSSNTGQTVFIEPEALIRTNNQLKLAEQEVEHELWLIRKALSELVAAEADGVRDTAEVLARLDSLSARALFSRELAGAAPEVRDGPSAVLRRARNPLLELKGSRVVPNDVVLGDGFRVLVVTGPNTGGKTVTLSTVGLCVLMAQAGYHVPADPDSVLPTFDAVFTSMGDAQNIDRDLSTFSGQLERLSEILGAADERSLVLIDEIIVGTEPSQGSALAVAFLEAFADRGVTAAVTTHYDRLKTLSYTDARFRNASVGLDPERMQPNFRLSTGLPGSSSPISIATRLGIDPTIVARATEIVGVESMSLDSVIRDLESERRRLSEERHAAENERRHHEEARQRLSAERDRLKRDAVRLAREECHAALEVADEARRELAALRKDVRSREMAEKEIEGKRRLVSEIEQKVKAATPPDPEKPAAPERRPLAFAELTAGMTVWVEPFGKEGYVEDAPRDAKRIPIAIGPLRTTVAIEALREAGRGAAKGGEARGGLQLGPKAPKTISGHVPNWDEETPPPKVTDNTVDLRGMRAEDAVLMLEKRLDAAATNIGPGVLWVVHGHGTGVLKKAVRDYLRASRYVAHARPGGRAEGGDGVTLVWVEQ